LNRLEWSSGIRVHGELFPELKTVLPYVDSVIEGYVDPTEPLRYGATGRASRRLAFEANSA
jgi:hypothetical protein